MKMQDPVEKAREEVNKILKDSEGVEAWKDVTFKVTDDLKLLFKGTAYFHKLSVLRIGGSVKSNPCRQEFIKLPDGSMELRLVEEKEPELEKSPPMKNLPDEESARMAKAKFQQIKPMLDMVLTGLHIGKSSICSVHWTRLLSSKRVRQKTQCRFFMRATRYLRRSMI
jgi:hypothetical protein